MRRALLLLCLPLAACGVTLPSRDPGPQAAAGAPASAAPPPPANASPAVSAPPPAAPRAGGRSNSTVNVPPPAPEEDDGPDPLTRARANCWMQVEHQKLRDLDRRIAFVDKCVADTMRGR